MRTYTKEVAEHLDSCYTDMVEQIYANDIAWDLSIGIPYKQVLKGRCYRLADRVRAVGIFLDVYNYMNV